MRKTAGYAWKNYNTNTRIAKELNMIPVLGKDRNTEEIGYNKQTEFDVIDYLEC